MIRLAVFASGEGSNLQALLNHAQSHQDWPGEIALIVSDKPECRAVGRARDEGIPVFAHRVKEFSDKAAYERAILGALGEHRIEWIVLAGYMRLIGLDLLSQYDGRVVNIHPSLLPQFPGRSAIEDALAAGVSETGVTIHYVDRGMDTGPVIAQWRVPIRPGEEQDAVANRIHRVEHHLYPVVVGHLLTEWAERGERS